MKYMWADLRHKNMDILKTEDIKEEALDIVDLSVNVNSGMEYEENVKEEKSPYDPQINIKIEINDIKDEGELELTYEQLKSIKIEDAFHKRDNECTEHTSTHSCISLDKLESDNGKCIKDIEIIKPEPKEEIDTFDNMESKNTLVLWEHNYCKYGTGDVIRHCKYKNNSQRHLKFNTQEPGLSYKNMSIVKNEDIKEEVTNILGLSSVKVRSDVEYVGHITHEFDIPLNEVGLESIKYEETIKEEISTSYDTEMSIKTDINGIKDEEDTEEFELSYKQVKSIKIEDEDYKRNCSNECLEHASMESCIPLDKLEPDNMQYNKNMEMIRSESNEENDTSDDIEEDLEKQNTVLQWEHDYCKYETEVKRHSKYINIIQRHKSHLQQQESNLSYKNMDSIKTEDIKEEVIDIVDSSSTGRSDIRLNEVDLASVKYEEIVEEKNAYQTEVKIKTEIDDIKSNIDTEEHELNCEQINIENAVYKRDCSNKRIEHQRTKCTVSLDRLEPERQYINNIETIEVVQNEEDASNDIEVSEYKNNIPQHTAAAKAILQAQFQETRKRNVKDFKCNFCEYMTNRIDYLQLHFRRHNKNAELYQCPYCKHTLKTRKGLVWHCRWKHKKDDVEWLQYNHIETIQFVQNEEDASNGIEVREHKNNIPQHTSLDPTYQAADKARDHLELHKNDELYQCPYCKNTLKTRKGLVWHCRRKHRKDDAKWLQCDICDFKTKYQQSLLQHKKSKHEAAKFFYCYLCDFKTKYKQCLSQHHKIKHRDATKMFHCERCDFKTKYKQSLSQHYTIKHDDAAEIFHCELCDFKTRDRYYLLYRHRLKHDDAAEVYQCELCGHETKYKYHLISHISTIHDTAKKLHCRLCNFKTKYKKSLLKHYKAIHEKGL